eukprot:g66537.t1
MDSVIVREITGAVAMTAKALFTADARYMWAPLMRLFPIISATPAWACSSLQPPRAPSPAERSLQEEKANPANKRNFEKCTFCSELVGLDEMVEHICSCKKYKEKYCMPEDFPFNADESYFVNGQDTSVEKWVAVRNQLVAKFLDQSLERLNLAIEHWRDTDQSVLRKIGNHLGTCSEPNNFAIFQIDNLDKFGPKKTVQSGPDPERAEMPDLPILRMAPLVYNG